MLSQDAGRGKLFKYELPFRMNYTLYTIHNILYEKNILALQHLGPDLETMDEVSVWLGMV